MDIKLVIFTFLVATALAVPPPPPSLFKAASQASLGSDVYPISEDDGVETIVMPKGFMGAAQNVSVTVQTMETDPSAKTIYSFLGLKYGEDPTGVKRFKKVKGYTLPSTQTELHATDYGSICPQTNTKGELDPRSGEDCLTLNVYTTQNPANAETLLPVMVYIHGGSFVSGDASIYKPEYLLEQDIILVTIQYRLGSLGFFTQLNGAFPGNAGLWDQIGALQWVQQNIEFLGGDKARVTIFGEGAGAVSANLLLLFQTIPGVTGTLFNNAIIEGGSALDVGALDPTPLDSATTMAIKYMCTREPILACMQSLSITDLTTKLDEYITEQRTGGSIGNKGASPVIQVGATLPVDDILLSESPETLIKNGDVIDVPVIMGANRHEGSYTFGVMWPYIEAKNESFWKNELIPSILGSMGMDAGVASVMADMIQADYMGDLDLGDQTEAAPGLIDLTGTLYIKSSVWRTATLLADSTSNRKSSMFFYSFEYENSNGDSRFDYYFDVEETKPPFEHGVCHGDELMYLFNLVNSTFDEADNTTRDQLVTLWTNFAKTGNPTPIKTNNLQLPTWESLSSDIGQYLRLEKDCVMDDDYKLSFHAALDDVEPTPEPTTTTPSGETTTTTDYPSWSDYNFIDQQRTAFMACMIVFIILAVGLGGGAGFLFYKQRK